MFGDTTTDLIAASIFVVLLIAACVFDLVKRRVPNWLVAVLAVGGLVYSVVGNAGLLASVAGLLLGLLIWIPSWLLRLLGAGDVKLFAASGAWLGPIGALEAAVWAGIIGGLLSLVWLLRYRGVQGTVLSLSALRVDPKGAIERDRDTFSPKALPYAIALAAGALIAAWFPRAMF
ncbi:MAG: prepilin peptidase [Gemmatimonadota bacterium]|nr:prepilin peptidase [Gemmatimonadota bacterium]